MNPHLWLDAFLQSRGLKLADGRPLYAYRCTKDEYNLLLVVLRDHTRLFKPQSGSRETAQLFCMVASEWWRRNHEAGSWKWEGILSETGFDRFPFQTLYPWIQRGLIAWKRPLLLDQRGRLFLVTLACEGGLPLKLVRRENSSLRSFFSHLLEEYGIFHEAGVRCHDLAERLAHFLPASLQNDVVFNLSGELVEEIWHLQELVEDSSTPVIDLDRRQPEWRNRLPLEIDDDVARDLLKKLVNEAHTIKRSRPARLRFNRYLVRVDGQWQLRGELTLPKTLSPEQLAELIGVEKGELPIRMQLLTATESGGRSLLALVSEQLGSNPKVYRVDSPPHVARSASGASAAAERALFASLGQAVLGPLSFTGSQALGDLPWVFVETEDGTARLVGTGSVGVRGNECIVAVPGGFGLRPIAEAWFDDRGRLPDLDRTVYSVSGSVEILGPDETHCRVVSGQATALVREYRLAGDHLHGVTCSGRPVFHGQPRLEAFEIPDTSSPRRIPAPKLEWRPREGGHAWLPISDQAFGEILLRAVSNGSVAYQGACSAMPAGFALELFPGTPMRQGSIDLTGLGEADVACTSCDEDLAARITSSDDNCRIALESSGPPPTSVRLRLRWSGGRRVDIEVPFPARGTRFTSGQGTTCRVDEEVPVDRLAGLAAIGLAVDSQERFWLDGVLAAEDVPTNHNVSLWADLQPVGLGQHRLDLQAIQERTRQLFAETSNLDAIVRLRVESKHEGLRPNPIRVTRFDLVVSPDRFTGQVVLEPGGSQFPVQDRLRLEAVPLWQPGAGRQALVEVDERRWDFDPDRREPGPWLILGWDGDWCRIRPLLWTVEGGKPSEDLDVLQKAVRADSESRPQRLVEAVQDLIEQPLHPAWSTALSFLRLIAELPPSILDFPVTMAKLPRGPITALMLASPQEALQIWHSFEELPFAWELIHAEVWINVARGYRDAILSTLGDIDGGEEIANSALDSFLQFAASKGGSIQVVGDCIRWVVLGVPREQTQIGRILELKQLFPSLVDSERQALIHRSEIRQWPRSQAWSLWLRRHQDAVPSELVSAFVEPVYKMSEFRWSVLELPPLAAIASVFKLPVDRMLLSELRRLRSFDQRWFDAAYEYTFRASVAHLVRSEPRLWQ